MPSSSKNVRLEDAKDWSAWDREFQSKAIAAHIWEKIDPEAEERPAFLAEPIEPDPRNYEKRIMQTQQAPANSTRHASQLIDDQPDPNGRPANANEMTTRGKDDYKLDLSVYNNAMRRFEKEDKSIKEIRDWVGETVKQHLLRTACQPKETLDTWYIKLRDQVGATPDQIYDLAKTKYQLAIKPLVRQPRDITIWLAEWEEAINQAIAAGIPNVQHSRDWWTDFEQAVNKAGFDAWCRVYRVNNKDDIRNNKLTFRTISNDFMTEIQSVQPPGTTKRTIQKGSHTASFKGSQAEKTIDPTTSSPPSSGPSPTTAKAPRRKRKNTEGATSGCKACGTPGHTLEGCYYIFPDKAFKKWKPRTAITQKVEDNIKNDDDLRKEVQRLKKKAKKVQFADSSSQEGLTTDTEDHN